MQGYSHYTNPQGHQQAFTQGHHGFPVPPGHALVFVPQHMIVDLTHAALPTWGAPFFEAAAVAHSAVEKIDPLQEEAIEKDCLAHIEAKLNPAIPDGMAAQVEPEPEADHIDTKPDMVDEATAAFQDLCLGEPEQQAETKAEADEPWPELKRKETKPRKKKGKPKDKKQPYGTLAAIFAMMQQVASSVKCKPTKKPTKKTFGGSISEENISNTCDKDDCPFAHSLKEKRKQGDSCLFCGKQRASCKHCTRWCKKVKFDGSELTFSVMGAVPKSTEQQPHTLAQAESIKKQLSELLSTAPWSKTQWRAFIKYIQIRCFWDDGDLTDETNGELRIIMGNPDDARAAAAYLHEMEWESKKLRVEWRAQDEQKGEDRDED